MIKKFYVLMISICMLLLASPALAQEEVDTCDIEAALQTTLARCAEGLPNTICYGFGDLSLSYQAGHPIFQNPDRVRFVPDGIMLPSDAVASFSSNETLGMSVIHLENEVGDSESSATLIIQGDIQLQDMSSEISILPECLAQPLNNNMNLRQEPNTNSAVLGVLPFQETTATLGRLEDSTWYLVNNPDNEGEAVWVFGELVKIDCPSENLPVYSPEGEILQDLPSYRPLQAFNLQTEAVCDANLSKVLVQSEGDFPLWVNGISLLVSGTSLLSVNPDNLLTVESLDGVTRVESDAIAHLAIEGTVIHVPVPPIPETPDETPPAIHPSAAVAFESASVEVAPISLLTPSISIPAPHDTTVLRNPEAVSGMLKPDEFLTYTIDVQAGYYLTLYSGAQLEASEENPTAIDITVISPSGNILDLPKGPTLGLASDDFSQRLPVWLYEAGTYEVLLRTDSPIELPFFLQVQGHNRNFCGRVIERQVGQNTFTMTYPFWGQAGSQVEIVVDAQFREDEKSLPISIYDAVPEEGQFIQGPQVLAETDTNTLTFEVPLNRAYFVQVQVLPNSEFRIETNCE